MKPPSILAQSYENIEILIADDASDDDTWRILGEYKRQFHNKIKIIRNQSNLGLAESLNHLSILSQGQYIARMDDDDFSFPDRIRKQFFFMQRYGVDVCGTWCRRRKYIGLTSTLRLYKNDENIKTQLLFQPPLIDPSTMFRRDLLMHNGGYRPEYPQAVDYDLWVRLVPRAKFGNVPEVLLDYTLSRNQVSRRFNSEQVVSARRIRERYLKDLKIPHSAEELATHIALRDPFPIDNLDALDSSIIWLEKLSAFFSLEVRQVFSRQLFLVAIRAAGLGPRTYVRWKASHLSEFVRPAHQMQLAALCMARLRYGSPIYRALEPLASI